MEKMILNEIAFTKISLPYGWLGNMAPFPIFYNDKMWKTSEALFQALRFDNIEIQEKIRSQSSPMSAKMIAKSNVDKMTIVPCSDEDLFLMEKILKLKLDQHEDLKVKLIDTGDACIIEDCTNRQRGSGLFWGAAKQDDGSWVGENHLGLLWQKLRINIKHEV